MSSKSPVFPMPEPHHFSDYGFDTQFDYFQVLEDARRKHRREAVSRSIDSIRFKLPKPTHSIPTPCCKNNDSERKKKKRPWWWNKAFSFFKCSTRPQSNKDVEDRDVHQARARAFRATSSSISGPVYSPDSRPTTPGRSDGGVAGSGCTSPYLSLRELNMERQQQHLRRMSGQLPSTHDNIRTIRLPA